jgi:superfamily II DNA helicase RecQ
MKVTVLTLHIDPATGAFDDQALQALCEDNEVLSVHEHLLYIEGAPALALLLTHRPMRRPGHAAPGAQLGQPPAPVSADEAERAVPEADRPLYAALRRWRNARAEADGKPPFIIFRNSQLADLARLRPATLADLRRVRGIGDGKSRDYGEELLALVAAAAAGGPPPALPRDAGDAGSNDG